ncbi:MAG: hypothetical protein DRR08_05965 [Candidatus Parabeggiatoa sp. nov. 2]|nr:MAG: hypothetical protein DRR08_05965 [Gammaproteobacteria bacterium]
MKGWEGDCQATGSDTTSKSTVAVTMDSNKTCKASFALLPTTLTVEKDGEGTVTSEPAGIDCGEDCSEAYDKDTEVTLTATPEAGWELKGWEGDCQGTGSDTTSKSLVAVTMDTDKTYGKASFVIQSIQLSLTVDKTGEGTITSEAEGINCGTDCTAELAENTEITLTATPADGYRFRGWTGDCKGTNNPLTVSVNEVFKCKAHFVKPSLCPANSLAINADDQLVDTQSCFTPKIPKISIVAKEISTGNEVIKEQPNHVALVNSAVKTLKLSATLVVDIADIGKPADIVMVAVHITLVDRLKVRRGSPTLRSLRQSDDEFAQ